MKDFRVITFDCYGTLIDWETGILSTLRPLFTRYGVKIPDAEVLENYAAFESAAESGPYIPYKSVLQQVVARFGEKFGFKPSEDESRSLEVSLPVWTPFNDTVDSLRTLKKSFRLAVISNIDDDLFARTAKVLGSPFDEVITAQQVKSYKPSRNNFERAIERLGVPPQEILHAAQSLYHDIAPARTCGMSTVWVQRMSGRDGSGATPASDAPPDFSVPDLQSLLAHVL